MSAIRPLRTLLLLCICGTTVPASAASFRTYAEVVNVQPLTETVYEPVTRQVCTGPDDASQRFTELSATIGEDIRRQQHLWQAQRSCRHVTEQQARQRIIAYRVTYRYRGHTSTRRLSYHPGERIAVNVSLSPLP